ncbi:MAG: hypothetical protein HFI05_00895 [Lachnospiraceae bacterium]|jgi:phage tail-like protein|nr:hypothetical protein [Lachnospiraceae bacterium]
MKKAQKYFMFNKKMDFQTGVLENLMLSEKGLTIGQNATGSFYSPLLDSREKKTLWHSMELEIEKISNTTEVEILIYASEEKECYQDGVLCSIEEIIKSHKITALEKAERFQAFLKKRGRGEEILLHGIEARFLWFELRFTGLGEILIKKIKIIFPKESWAEYLPDIYQQDLKSYSFVERYLGIFQSIYEKMTKEIRQISRHFDPDVAENEYLSCLVNWVGLQDSFLWEIPKLRYLIGHAAELYRKRGTVSYLMDILEIYLGNRPYIVEYHQVLPFMTTQRKEELLKRLYGENNYIFTVIIDAKAKINRKDIPMIDRIVENEKPAHMESNLVILEPYIFLGWHSYLGMNSVLSDFHSMVLDGQASIPFTKLQEERRE